MPIALIAAAAGEKLVIGKNGDLPWHFSSDLKFFKQKTLGHTVVMGRVTYQSILNRLGKPLPGRKNIVLTRDKNFADERVTIIHDPAIIPTLAAKDDLLCVIGGAKVYTETITYADILYITHIDQEIEGDAFFPPIDKSKWQLAEEIPLIENGVTLRFYTYEKIK
jgi:dihydrofolate reductase